MGKVQVLSGDCIQVMRAFPDDTFDSIVTDPPYGLEFMGKDWDKFGSGKKPRMGEADGSKFRQNMPTPSFTDSGNPVCRNCKGDRYRRKPHKTRYACECQHPDFGNPVRDQMVRYQAWCEEWARECLRVLKPGGHLLAFGGTRTYHRMACGIEDAGFEIRDSLHWIYGSGFCKSLNLDRDARFCHCDVPQLMYGNGKVQPVRQGIPDVSSMAEKGEVPDLFPSVQRESKGTGMGEIRSSGSCGMDGSEQGLLFEQDDRSEQSCMKRGCDSQTPAWELQGSEVCSMSPGVSADGPQGRVHYGTSPGDGAVDGQDAVTDGSGESQGSQSIEQCQGELGVVSDESGPQTSGVWEVCGRCGKPAIPRGLGTGLKPAHEPVVVARKPLVGTVAANVLAYGTGALNIDGTRIPTADRWTATGRRSDTGSSLAWSVDGSLNVSVSSTHDEGRWPANILLTHAEDCQPAGTRQVKTGTTYEPEAGREMQRSIYGGTRNLGRTVGYADADGMETVEAWDCAPGCPVAELDRQSGTLTSGKMRAGTKRGNLSGWAGPMPESTGQETIGDSGGASRFFPCFRYQAKAPSSQRPREDDVSHPTVKPLDLMRWLVRLVTPPDGLVLDPFAGSGTTGEACLEEGFRCVLVEREPGYVRLIRKRLDSRVPTLWD